MNSNLEINLERILILGTTLLNMLYDNLVHSIGTIEYWVIDIIFIVHMGLVIAHIGIETRCGWIGYGDMMVGTHGVHLIGGHHLDMIDGDITYTMVGITMDVTKPRVNVTKPRVNNTRPVIRTKPKDDIRTLYPSGFINSNPTTIPNNVRPRVNNSRPVINRSTPTKTNGKPNRNNNTTNRRKN